MLNVSEFRFRISTANIEISSCQLEDDQQSLTYEIRLMNDGAVFAIESIEVLFRKSDFTRITELGYSRELEISMN